MGQDTHSEEASTPLANTCSHCGFHFGWKGPPLARHSYPVESGSFMYCPRCRRKQALIAVPRNGLWTSLSALLLMLAMPFCAWVGLYLLGDPRSAHTPWTLAGLALIGPWWAVIAWRQRPSQRQYRAFPPDDSLHWRYDSSDGYVLSAGQSQPPSGPSDSAAPR